MYVYIYIYTYTYTYTYANTNTISWWHPASKNLLRLEAGYPALRCHNLEEEPLTPPQRLKKIPPGLEIMLRAAMISGLEEIDG